MKKSYNIALAIVCLFIMSFTSSFDTKKYYSILQKGTLVEIEEMESILKKNDNKQNAYLGALRIKKADVLKFPKDKIETTKKGVALLEKAITDEPGNVEFRFLRLIMQENCPKFIGYNKNLEEDKLIILKNYKNQSAILIEIILDYSKTSSILKIN